MANTGQPHADTLLEIAEGLDVVLINDNEVLIQFGTRSYPSELLRDTELKGILGRVIQPLLQAPRLAGDLLSNLREEDRTEASDLISDLLQRGVLTEVDRNPVEQYLRYTFDGVTKLAERSVSLFGAGPLGGRLAHSLLQHGVGRITVADDRQADQLWNAFPPFGLKSAQEPNGTASQLLCERLIESGYSQVTNFEGPLDTAGVEVAVSASDVTLVAFEQPNLRLSHLINRLCIQKRKPWMLATIDGNLGLVGPLFLPVQTACYNDYRTLVSAATPGKEMSRLYRKHLLRRISSFFPGLPAYLDIVAGHASLAIVHFLLRDTSFALGRLLVIDFDRMRIDIEDVLKLPRCPVCGDEKNAYRPPFSADVATPSSS